MAVEGISCNGAVKLEESPRKGVITYRRRKRSRSSLDAVLALETTFRKERNKDIGWEHGEIVDGNRFHWMCNWCGMIRYGGGVSRLKKHLAGVCHVKKCPNVPEEVAKSMMEHLMEKQRERKKRLIARSCLYGMKSSFPHDDLFSEDHKKSDMEAQLRTATQFLKGITRKSKSSTTKSRSATQRSKITAQLLYNGMDKQGLKDNHDAFSCTGFNGRDRHDTIKDRWRNVLERMLQLLDMHEAGGIRSCICDALTYDPYGFTGEFKRTDVPADIHKIKEVNFGDCDVKGQYQNPVSSQNAARYASETGTSDQTETNINTLKCQKFFLDILCSEKFALLCNLFRENFQDRKVKFFFDFSLINSKMKNGDYEQSPELFDQDIQKVWNKFQKVGEEMVLLASSLSSLSQVSCQKQVGEYLVHEADEHKAKASMPMSKSLEISHAAVERKSSVESYNTTQIAFCESDFPTKCNQIEPSGRCKVCFCKQCGSEANEQHCFICDGCDAAYHFSCINPVINEISTRTWYCASCTRDNKDSSEPVLNHGKEGCLHQNCTVCDRLEVSGTQNDLDGIDSRIMMALDSRESSVSSMESDDPAELSKTAKSGLCKICGTCEDEDKKFLICGHVHCPYKFYHIRCLKSSQIASAQQQNKSCWYCPSCLCRACLCDKDDDQIVLCDGCDEAYHTYCMKPPRTSIPKGQWYCVPCNVARAKEGMRRYEEWILQQHRKNYSQEANRSMDLLLCAAEKLKSEEQLVSGD